MKNFVSVGWCAIVALSMGSSPALGWAQETQTTPAAAEPAAASLSPCRCLDESGEAVAKILRVLSEPLHATGLDFTEEPLENVVNFLQDEYDIPIRLDTRALEDIGLTTDEAATTNLQNISLQSALRLLLRPLQLTYIIRDEVLVITSRDEAEAELTTCVYDVRDLIGENKENKNVQALIDAITSCIAMETWAKNGGGEAEIRPLQPGILVISQTRQVHVEIAKLLGVIRQILN